MYDEVISQYINGEIAPKKYIISIFNDFSLLNESLTFLDVIWHLLLTIPIGYRNNFSRVTHNFKIVAFKLEINEI